MSDPLPRWTLRSPVFLWGPVALQMAIIFAASSIPALGALPGGSDSRLAEMQTLLTPVGKVEIKPNILAAKWMKLVVNAMCLGPFAMVGMPLIDALKVPGMRDLIIEVGEEAMRVGHDLGHPVEPIFGLTDVDPQDPEAFVDRMLDAVYAQWSLPHTRTTVLQDWMKGRHSEFEEINGLVAREQERSIARVPRGVDGRGKLIDHDDPFNISSSHSATSAMRWSTKAGSWP